MNIDMHPIPGFSKYFITKDCELFSAHRKILFIKKPQIIRGYRVYKVFVNGKGKGRVLFEHRAMMLAFKFIENNQDFEIDHIDGDRANNKIENLRWCTREQNNQYTMDRGAFLKGVNHNMAKLSESDVLSIILSHKNKEMSIVGLSKKYSVTESHIQRIITGKSWKHLTKLDEVLNG